MMINLKKIDYMKKFLLFVVMGVLGCTFTGCQNDGEGDASVSAISLGTPSKTQFDHFGGLGSVDAYAGNRTVTAESSNPEWCTVTVIDNRTVAFNLYENFGNKERSATITVSAEGLPSEEFSVTQSRLTGLVVTPTDLNFTSERRTISVEVIASCAYEIVAEANPDDTFTWKKSSDGKVVDFSSKDPGNYEVDGRVVLVPEEGEEVAVTLKLEKMNPYEFFIGEWRIDQCDQSAEDGGPTSVIISRRIDGYDYNLWFVGVDDISTTYPVRAGYEDGKICIYGAQEMGNDGTNFYNLHYNGYNTSNPGSTLIFISEPQTIYWSAEPQYDENENRVTLSFADSGKGLDRIAATLNIFRGPKYFEFITLLFRTDHLVISKAY